MIYIRHGEKVYNNRGGEKGLDSPLKEKSRKEVRKKARELIAEYGVPNTIFVSPYLRARQTAEEMKKEIKQDIDLIVLPELGEYLGNWREINENMFEGETFAYGIIKEDSFEELKQRAKKGSLNNCWYITHGTFIEALVSNLEDKRYYPKFLRGVHIGEKITFI